MSFDRNVFINCPFDEPYRPLLKATIFTILHLGLEPLLSTTKSSGHIRIEEIKKLISQSKYSIHDISRCEADGEPPRFNMPYEMGLDVGCCAFGNKKHKNKQCLILEAQKNRYDVVISDISGQDIKEHENDPKKLVSKLLDWFDANGAIDDIPSPSVVWRRYEECTAKIEVTLMEKEFTKDDINNLTPSQLIKAIKSAIGS